MFYRRKILLALLQLFDNELEKIRFQKLLFLITQRQQKPDYDFVPYKYGCYSYSANADLTAMVKKGILSETKSHFICNENTDYFKTLKEPDKKLLLEAKKTYGQMSSTALMRYTYIKYPFWAINSVTVKSILSVDELHVVNKSLPNSKKTALFTIGYEGNSLEAYLNRLIQNDIKVLVDVRNKPLSMKYGFSKSQLKRYCESLDIQYLHFPEVGIQSEKRQALNTQADYDKLFVDYRHSNLTQTITSQKEILNILKTKKRIALTCFEAEPSRCHRTHLADAISKLPDFNFQLIHL